MMKVGCIIDISFESMRQVARLYVVQRLLRIETSSRFRASSLGSVVGIAK